MLQSEDRETTLGAATVRGYRSQRILIPVTTSVHEPIGRRRTSGRAGLGTLAPSHSAFLRIGVSHQREGLAGLRGRYDAIADLHRDSKRLPIREAAARYALFEMPGDTRGKTAVERACGDGLYARLLKRAGAFAVTRRDISAEMIPLAEQEELRQPLRCGCPHQDMATFAPTGSVDVIVAVYLLNWARTGEHLRRFCRVSDDALRPGGRFVGFNGNVRNPPQGSVSRKKHGLENRCAPVPKAGESILYTVTKNHGRQFQPKNFFPTTRGTYRTHAGTPALDLCLRPQRRSRRRWHRRCPIRRSPAQDQRSRTRQGRSQQGGRGRTCFSRVHPNNTIIRHRAQLARWRGTTGIIAYAP